MKPGFDRRSDVVCAQPKNDSEKNLRILFQASEPYYVATIDMEKQGEIVFLWNDPRGNERDSVWIHYLKDSTGATPTIAFQYTNSNGVNAIVRLTANGQAEGFSMRNARLIWERLIGDNPSRKTTTVKKPALAA